MTVTREWRNAGLVDEGVEAVGHAVEELAVLYRRVLPHLPDDFPLLHSELADAERAVEALRAVLGTQPTSTGKRLIKGLRAVTGRSPPPACRFGPWNAAGGGDSAGPSLSPRFARRR